MPNASSARIEASLRTMLETADGRRIRVKDIGTLRRRSKLTRTPLKELRKVVDDMKRRKIITVRHLSQQNQLEISLRDRS